MSRRNSYVVRLPNLPQNGSPGRRWCAIANSRAVGVFCNRRNAKAAVKKADGSDEPVYERGEVFTDAARSVRLVLTPREMECLEGALPAEREACAQVAATWDYEGQYTGVEIAAAIRARGEKS